MFEKELQFFIANQDDLVRQYRGKTLILKDLAVVGAYPSALAAYLAARQQYAPGTFMLQPCEPGPGAYTVTLSETPLPTQSAQ